MAWLGAGCRCSTGVRMVVVVLITAERSRGSVSATVRPIHPPSSPYGLVLRSALIQVQRTRACRAVGCSAAVGDAGVHDRSGLYSESDGTQWQGDGRPFPLI